MPLHDLLDRGPAGLRLSRLFLGMLLAVAAHGTALLLDRTMDHSGVGFAMIVVALGAAGASGCSERAAEGGVGGAIGSALMVSMGFGVGYCLMLPFLPVAAVPSSLTTFATAMPIGVTPEQHELADGPAIYGAFLIAGGLAALAGSLFASTGTLVVLLMHVLAWSVLLGRANPGRGLSGIEPMLRGIGAAAPFLLLALGGLACLGAGAREVTRRLLGQRRDHAGLRTPGLGILIGLILMLAAASVELFAGGLLARLLDG
jgi:hypothetical protein